MLNFSLAALLGLLISPLPPSRPALATARASPIVAKLDYKDPSVAAEFTVLQKFSRDEVENELAQVGIRAPATMNEMDVRLMLVEMRMRKAGTYPGASAAAAKNKPTSYGSKYEEALWEKPGFKALISEWQRIVNTNALNLATEYLNNPKQAAARYAGTPIYDKTLKEIEAALAMKMEQKVTSGRISFSGFPAAMGEAGLRKTLGMFGEIKSMEVEAAEDGLSCSGKAEFDSSAAAKKCIEKYDGVDMGLGTKLSFTALP